MNIEERINDLEQGIKELEMIELFEKCLQFVKVTCEGRDPSHGLEHMEKVCDNAAKIYEALSTQDPTSLPSKQDVALVALLHDVADHKYDKDGSLSNKVQNFLLEHNIDPYPITNCISAISFSKESHHGKRWFLSVLDPYWVKVRDIVSDADKLEAIGKIGVDRCLEYAKSIGHQGPDAVRHLLQQMHDKLLLLKDQYIVTEPAKIMAQPLHDEMVNYVLNIAIQTFGSY